MGKIIDDKDLEILRLLQNNGRMPIVDLSVLVNLSKTPCLQRVRRLEKDGYIRGYYADLDPEKVARGYLVYVQIKLENTSRQTLASFNAAIHDIPEILVCHLMSGGFDYLLKVRTKDMAEFRDFMSDKLSNIPGISTTSTFPVIEEVKETTAMPVRKNV